MLADVRAVWHLGMAGLAWAVPAQPCTIVQQPATVGTSFAVRVTDRGRPVVNTRITSGDRLSATTNQQGVAYFAGVPPGSYRLSTTPWLGGDMAIQVKAGRPAAPVLTLERAAHFARTSSLRGTLAWGSLAWGSGLSTQATGSALTLELRDARTNRLLERIETRGGQTFAFAERPLGSYWLSYASEAFGKGAIPVELVANGPESLDLWLTESSCGHHFTNLAECPAQTLTLRRLTGRVADTMSAAIPRASAGLATDEGRLVRQGETDEQGRFTLGEVPAGRYTLTLTAPGFGAFRSLVEVQEAGASSVGEVQLPVLSGCARVRPGP